MINIPVKQTKNIISRTDNLQNNENQIGTANEEAFIYSLSAIAEQILSTLHSDQQQYQRKMGCKQKEYIINQQNQQRVITELANRNEQLSHANKELRLRLDQSLRHQKRCQMKIQLLINKIKLVSHQLTQKDAVIKYLQHKNQDIGNYNSKKIANSSLNQINISLVDESLSSFRSKYLSFIKLKETKVKFEDFTSSSNLFINQFEQRIGFKNKTKRIRTQSSYDLKQNKNQDNFTQYGINPLNDFLNGNKVCINSTDKTMTKKTKHNSNNSWVFHNNRQSLCSGNKPKNINFNSSTYFYGRPEHICINSKQFIN